MKKTITFGLLFAFAAVIAVNATAKAQDTKKELLAFTKKYQEAYNRKDDKAIKMMYTADAVRTEADGKVITGSDNIAAATAASWANAKTTVTIKHEKNEAQADGSVIATGTYHVTGTSNAGEKIEINGTYTNTVVKENGKWKISKMTLTKL